MLNHRALVFRKTVNPGRDQRLQRGWNFQTRDIGGEAIGALALGQATIAKQHPDDLDGVQRNAFSPLEDLAGNRIRQAAGEAVENPGHGIRRKRLELQGSEVALAGSPGRSPFEELPSSQGDDEDGVSPAPFQEVLDEVEEALVGPMQLLENHDSGPAVTDAFEEGSPRGKQFLARALRRRLETEQGAKCWRQPGTFILIGHEPVERFGKALTTGRGVIGFGYAAPLPKHLA